MLCKYFVQFCAFFPMHLALSFKKKKFSILRKSNIMHFFFYRSILWPLPGAAPQNSLLNTWARDGLYSGSKMPQSGGSQTWVSLRTTRGVCLQCRLQGPSVSTVNKCM